MIDFPNAKINIGLNVIEKRKDGFHNIESIFYPIFDLYDSLEIIEIKSEIKNIFTSSGIKIPGNEKDNLCLKACNIVQQDYQLPFVKIHLHKNIPTGAGLGGGSSDAAFTLKILGSDCAFFIQNKPVFAFNKGDDFENINLDLSAYRIDIKFPKIYSSTAEAYFNILPQKPKLSLIKLINYPISDWKNSIKNDFEAELCKKYPEILDTQRQFYKEGAIYSAMTGSGSAVFGIFKN